MDILTASVVYSRPYALFIKIQQVEGKFGLLIARGYPQQEFKVLMTIPPTMDSKEELIKMFGRALKALVANWGHGESGPFTPMNEAIIEHILKDLGETEVAKTYEYATIDRIEEERLGGY